jgi:hypothetical protein
VSIYTIAFVTQILNERSLVQFPEDRSLQIPSRRYCRSCSFPRLLWNQRKKYIMIPILRAITLFDQEIRNVSLYYSVPSIVDSIYRLLIYCACVNVTKSYHKCKVKEPEPRFMKTPLISQTHRREWVAWKWFNWYWPNL